MREFHEQTEIIKRIDSTTSRIDSTTFRIETLIIDEIINKPDKPEANVISLASNLPPCPPAKKLYNREDKPEIFKKLAEHRMSCIAGMAGVGKSTLAITYGHHRKQVHQAKVFIFLKNV
jgi:putative ribosome biogenesis GTPase RsgA